MRKAESIFSFVIALLCLGYLFFVWKMDELGSVNEPGAAFFPAVLGMLGLATSLKLLLTSMLAPADGKAVNIPKPGLLRFLIYLAASLLFIPFFENLGANIAIFMLVLVLTKVLGAKGWVRPVALASASSAVAYLLFVVMLEVPLPRGLF